jgi:TolB-like protein
MRIHIIRFKKRQIPESGSRFQRFRLLPATRNPQRATRNPQSSFKKKESMVRGIFLRLRLLKRNFKGAQSFMKPVLRIFIAAGLLIGMSMGTVVVAADTPKKVLILPFQIHSEEDLSFLQNGIQDMLATRLSFVDKVVTYGKEAVAQAIEGVEKPIKEPAAFQLGRSAGADYVVLGSMTVFGENISTDMKFLDVGQNTAPVTLSQFGKGRGEVLAHVDMFAGQVNEKVFGRKTYTYASPGASPAALPADDRRRHPESVFTKDNELAESAVWRSRRFKMEIRGLSVADVDGDKRNEAVFIDKNAVFVYRYTEGTVEKVAEYAGGQNESYIGVDASDINGDGKAEIFINNILLSTRQLSSFVLEWKEKGFSRILDHQAWFYRVVRVPQRGSILFGQKFVEDRVYTEDICELAWQGKEYAPTNEKRYLKPIHVFGVAFGSSTDDGRQATIAFTADERIRLFDEADGSEIWRTEEKYGGNSLYIEFEDKSAASIGGYREMKNIYLPQRIHLVDIDKDGKKEVLVPKNKDFAGNRLERLRVFDRGYIEGFEWTGLELTPKWKTRQLSGYISDCVIADFDNDGQDEIVCAVVSQAVPVIGGEKSYIVMMELNQ